jgi:hypothetical protein
VRHFGQRVTDLREAPLLAGGPDGSNIPASSTGSRIAVQFWYFDYETAGKSVLHYSDSSLAIAGERRPPGNTGCRQLGYGAMRRLSRARLLPRLMTEEELMEGPLLREQAPAEYFRELVDAALARRRVKAGDLTAFYLVNLLCDHVRPEARRGSARDAEPLALRLGHALASGGAVQRAELRSLGDFSLFMSGFFSDSFNRRAIDVDYYVSMGEYAYGSLSRRDESTFAEVFSELARKFVGFMDVLADISEQTALTSSGDVLRLYEKWLRTGSARDGQKLIDRGIVPNGSVGNRFIQ